MIHTLLRSAAPQRAVLTLALFLCASILAHAATWYVRTGGNDTNDGTSTATAFLTIQKAINSAANGDVIDVGAGTFAENITVNKRVTIDGAGSGSDASSNTIITAAASGTSTIVYSAGGSDASNRQVLRDVRVTGASGGTGNNNSGILISGSSNMGYFTFDNIVSTGNTGHGFISNFGSPSNVLSYVYIGNSSFESNGSYGLRTASHSIDSLTIENVTFQDNASLGMGMNPSESNSANLGRITLTDVTFSGNATVAEFYAYRLTGSMALSNVDFVGDGGAGQAYYIQGQYLSETAAPVAGSITLSDVSITGSYTTSGMRIQGYSDCSSISFSDVVLNATISTADRGQLHLNGLASTIDLGNTSFGTGAPLFIRLGGNFGAAGSKSTISVDATNATFDGKKGSEMTPTELFDLEDRIRHGLDNTTDAPGFVRVNASNVYATANSGSIQRGINAATAGDVVNVQAGTYAEGLNIGKSLTLRGPNADESPNTGTRVAEAIIKPSGGSSGPHGITGTAANITVVVEGFTVDMVDTRWDAGYPEDDSKRYFQQTGKQNTTWTFENNIFQNTGFADSGHWLFNGSSPNLTFNLLDNLFRNTATERNGYSNGISIWDTNPATINIQDNVWNSTGYTAMNLNNCHGTIANNTFVETRDLTAFDPDNEWFVYQSGILLANPNFDLDITGNTFTNVTLGVVFYGNADGSIDVTGNTFSGTRISSIRLSSGQADPNTDLDGVSITDNSFLNYAGGSDKELSSSRTDGQVVQAACNYFGTDDYTQILARVTPGAFTVAPYRVGSVSGDCLGGPVKVYANATDTEPQSAHGTIQSAIDAGTTVAGNVIRVDAGTYNEAITVNKQLSIIGSGSGTIIQNTLPNGTVMTYTAPGSGASASDRAVLKDVVISGSTKGILVTTLVNYLTLDGVTIKDNTSYGIHINNTSGTMTDWYLTNCTFDANSSAIYISTAANISALSILDCTFMNNVNSAFYVGQSSSTPGGLSNVSISGCTFIDNGTASNNSAAMYIEKLSNASISGNTYTNNGTPANPRAIIVNLKYGSYTGVTISNNIMADTRGGTLTSGYGINVQGRNDAGSYNTNPGSLDNVYVTGNSVSGFNFGITIENAVDWNTTEVSNNVVANCTHSILGVVYGTGNTANSNTTLTVTNNSITGSGTTSVGNWNPNGGTISATCNWYGSADAATVASKISGNVDATPFLVDGTDSSTDPGFQPVGGACTGTGPVIVYSDVAESTLVDTYFTIQSAIDAATTLDGYVVRVPAGTYAEQLYISKELALRGANYGVAGNGTRGPESIIEIPAGTGVNDVYLIYADVDNITVDGFDLRIPDAFVDTYSNLWASAGLNNLTIRNNRMYGGVIPIYIYPGAPAKSGLLIERNYIDGGPCVNSLYGRGMYITNTAGIIQDNILTNVSIGIQYMPYENDQAGIIRRNTVEAALIGLYHNYQNLGAEDVLWEDNSVTVAPNDQQGLKAQVFGPWTTPVTFRGIHVITHGIQGTGDAPSVTFQNNDINCALDPAETYNSTNREGFRISNGVSGTVTLENNSFVGYTTAVNYVSDCPTSCGATVTATCNWWGTASATAIASSIGSNASFLPFLSSVAPGDYTNPGFTPSGACDGLGPVTSDDPVASYMTIQAAIDAANDEATITASAGTYTENVNLNKEVTLTGTGATIAGTTTISDEDAVLTNMTLNGSPALIIGSGIGSYTLGASNTFDAACTTYVWTNPGNVVTLPGTTVLGGTTLSTLTPNAAENYAIEDKINHGVDDSYAGIVRWNGNRLYVTANTGTLQHVIDVASTSDAIYIDNITVNANPVLYKDIVLNSRSSAARRLGTNNYFVFGTTSLGTSNFSGFTTGELDKIGVNTNGSVSEAITAVNISGTVLLTTEVQTGGSASAEFDAFTFTNKAITVEGNGTTGANCDVAPVISIASVSGPALTSEGDANRSLKNVTLKLGASGSTFVRVTNGSIGDISVQDVRFQRGSEFITGLQPLTTPAALNDGKDIPEFLQDGADVGFGPGKVLFGQGAPFNATNVVAAWKGNDANSNSVQTLYSYSSTSLNLSQSFLTRRPSRSVNNGDFNSNTVIGIPTSGDRFLQALASSDVVSGNEKTIFIVFRTPPANTTDRVIYKHGDELNGISLIYDDQENVQFNIFNNRTSDASTFETFETALAPNTVAIAQLYFDGGSDNRRVGAALDWGTNSQLEAFANSTAFAATTLSAPAALNLTSAINVGALASGKTYFEGATQTRSTPGFTLKGGFIGEIIVLNTADAATRNDVYCYLHKKYNLGNNENGLERAIPVYDDEEIMAGAENTVWPNPATDVASVAFNVPESQFVTITLVDALGRPVANVASEYMMAGEQIFDITLENVPSGLYTVAINGFTFNTSAPVMVRK